ncbi:IS4 family transposase [Aporhodopirellula aestuarii]
MTVYTFFREVAKLGGFLGRASDGEPGWQTVWRGYRKLQSLLDGMNLIGGL